MSQHQPSSIRYYMPFYFADEERTAKSNENDTPLMLAIRYYDSFTEKHFETAGTLERGETRTSIVSFLLNYADINSHNASGMTPLSLSVQKQNEGITKLLLDNPNTMDQQAKPARLFPTSLCLCRRKYQYYCHAIGERSRYV